MDISIGKVVLITGCSSGFGKLAAETLSSKGYVVYAGIRKEQDLHALTSQWRGSPKALKLDVTSDEDCGRAVHDIIIEQGRLDVLINNASYTLVGPAHNSSPQDYLDILNTNCVGAFRLIREVVGVMKRQHSGRIINITSLNGIVALPNFSLYSSSKFALDALGVGLRYELGTFGVHVTNIAPGAIRSPSLSTVLPHTSARDRFLFLKLLMPMLKPEAILEKLETIINASNPPARIILGRDAQITTLAQRFAPSWLWDKLLRFVWGQQQPSLSQNDNQQTTRNA